MPTPQHMASPMRNLMKRTTILNCLFSSSLSNFIMNIIDPIEMKKKITNYEGFYAPSSFMSIRVMGSTQRERHTLLYANR